LSSGATIPPPLTSAPLDVYFLKNSASDPVLSNLAAPPSPHSEDTKFPISWLGINSASNLLTSVVKEIIKRSAMEASLDLDENDGGEGEFDSQRSAGGRKVVIRQEHVIKVAGEVLMDFS